VAASTAALNGVYTSFRSAENGGKYRGEKGRRISSRSAKGVKVLQESSSFNSGRQIPARLPASSTNLVNQDAFGAAAVRKKN